MLITGNFVMLNYPKTGSSFARAVIKEIYAQRLLEQSFPHKILPGNSFANTIIKEFYTPFIMRRPYIVKVLHRIGMITSRTYITELMLPNIKLAGNQISVDQHGTYQQIPTEYRDREVVSIVRNPYSRFLSSYEFRWWEKHPVIDEKILTKYLPQFPALSIDDYVRYSELKLIHGRLNNMKPKAQIGNQSAQFIQMFFKNPQSVLDKITDEYIESDLIFDDMGKITFLRQEKLKKDLATFLLGKGFTQDEINYMKQREKVNVTNKTDHVRRQLWTQETIEYISQKDRLIFRILESQGIYYEKPTITEENSTNYTHSGHN